MQTINSRQNPFVKMLKKLVSSSSARRREGLAVAEGPHLVREAVQSGAKIERVVVSLQALDKNIECAEIISAAQQAGLDTVCVTGSCYEAFSSLRSPEGIAVVFKPEVYSLSDIINENCRLAVLAGVQDPGNSGAVVRTAEAALCSAVVVCDGVDITHPGFIRAAMGASMRLPVVCTTAGEFLSLAEKKSVSLYALDAGGDTLYDSAAYAPPCAVVTGSEGEGLPALFREATSSILSIPMGGKLESLNTAVAAGIVLYEARKRWA